MGFLKYNNRRLKFNIIYVTLLFVIFAFTVLAEAATIYYVDATDGNDSSDGISAFTAWKTITKVNGVPFSPGDSILFKRGEIWREQLRPRSGDTTGYVTYGAYGTGNKPVLLGSVTKNDVNDWTNEGGNIWSASGMTVDVGNLIFNNEESVGIKVKSEANLDTQGKFWYDQANLVLKLYSYINPATFYLNIECALRKHIISESGKSYVIYENLDLRYGGAHGIGGGGVHHIIVRDSDFSYIGGGIHGNNNRYGNGIEFWDNSHDTTVERCRLWEIYDAALTTQGNGTNQKYNQYFRQNIIWNSEYCFEFWNRPATSTTDNIVFEYNTCVNAGHGWGHNQRWGAAAEAGWINGRHLAFYANTASTNNFYVRNNIFYESTNALLHFDDPWAGIEDAVLDYNVWYQSSGNMITYFCTYSACADVYTMDEFAQYQTDTGKDTHSLATDALFNDIGNNDFHPVTGSPACTLSITGNFVGALPCIDTANDTDGDGMPDSFENFHGLDPNNPDDANYDNDTDGLTNLWEYILGTDPTNPDTDGDGIGDASDLCPVNSPVNIAGTDYSSLQIAYNNSAGGIIQSHDTIFTEDLTFNINKSIIWEGGYDCPYSSIIGSTTVIGNMTISDGNVTIQNGSIEVE